MSVRPLVADDPTLLQSEREGLHRMARRHHLAAAAVPSRITPLYALACALFGAGDVVSTRRSSGGSCSRQGCSSFSNWNRTARILTNQLMQLRAF